MNLTLRQLRVFEAVATQLSYTRAAEQLHLSQPAVSMQVKQLEEMIGLPLLDKVGKKVFLTQAGEELHHYAHAVFDQLEEAEEVLESLKGLKTGRLDIAVASTVNYFAPRLLSAFKQRYPGVTLTLEVTNRRTLIRRLENNERDLVLMGAPPTGLDLEAEPFMENQLVVIAQPDHPLAEEREIPFARLGDECFVMREPGSGTRAAMERHFADHGVEIRINMEMTRGEAIKQAVRAGMGLGVVSTHTIELELETRRLVVLDVEEFPIERQWYIVYRRGKRLSPAALAFHDFVLEEAHDLAGQRF
ncbi:LysR family transcriptional regulator [Endothiovibrio diazotrophicus]